MTDKMLSFWAIFCPFSPLTTWRILKWKKTLGGIIILHICTINENHMMCGFWDMEHHRQNFLSFWAIFCPVIKKKWKKPPSRYYHFTYVYYKWQSYDVWFLRYQAWRTEFVAILDHFLPKKWKKKTVRYYHFTYVYHKWQSCDVWFLSKGAWQTEFFVILDYFLNSYPLTTWKNQNLKKVKKTPGNIILHMCTINDNHMMYGSWDMEHEGHNFL